MSCNWGKVPSDAIVTTSASSFEKRKIYQKFLEKAAKLYRFGNQNNGTRHDQDRNTYDRQPQYDQFGNRIDQPIYDNRNNRFKRQNFGDFGTQSRPQYDPNIPQYEENRPNYDRTPYDQNNNYDQYGRDRPPYQRNNTDYDPYRRGQDSGNRDGPTYPFDPHDFNREEYGENIDPYGDRRKPPIYNNSIPDYYDYNRNNNTFYEVFNLFESSPRYGIHGNLLFQVYSIDFFSRTFNNYYFGRI